MIMVKCDHCGKLSNGFNNDFGMIKTCPTINNSDLYKGTELHLCKTCYEKARAFLWQRTNDNGRTDQI